MTKRLTKDEILQLILVILIVLCTIGIASLSMIHITSLKGTALSQKQMGMTTTVSGYTDSGEGYIVCDSIMQGVAKLDLPDGDYTLRVNGQTDNGTIETIDYEIELVNYKQDMAYSLSTGETTKNIALGNGTSDKRMLVVKYWGNLTVDSGVTLTATTRKKGMYLHVDGNITNNGGISMTARGANAVGENVYLWKKSTGFFEYIPSAGSTGGAKVYSSSVSSPKAGSAGAVGKTRSTGGGGAGAAVYSAYSGDGASGTSYSGGTGGGGGYYNQNGIAGSSNGGSGGSGRAGNQYTYGAGGGAGNPGGAAVSNAAAGGSGTGGLLILYTSSLINTGSITSNGVAGGWAYRSGGGGSGGGSINIFYSEGLNSTGTIAATAGAGGRGTRSGGETANGGAGGNGSVTTTNLAGYLSYPEKQLTLQKGNSYVLDKTKLSYVQGEGLTGETSIDQVSYSVLDDTIAKIDADSGKITGIVAGNTKIKITDTVRNRSTYVYLTVKDTNEMDLQAGTNFAVGLKQDGSVWTWGTNDNGQLGNGSSENSNIPKQVGDLANITQIATGYNHVLALDKNGKVYTWGDNRKEQLGDTTTVSKNTPILVDGLTNIKKIEAYKNISLAFSENGELYVWGEGYSNLPMKLVVPFKIADISGRLVLSEDGLVYLLNSFTTPIKELSNIAKIACGEDHYLALSPSGIVYGWGDNTQGELGKSGQVTGIYSIRGDGLEIKAGFNNSMIQTNNKEVYVTGLNTSGQLGIGSNTNLTAFKKIEKIEDISVISLGEGTHNTIGDKKGNVWVTGTNTKGELGTGDATNRNSFEKIGGNNVYSNLENGYFAIGEEHELTYGVTESFNLKETVSDNKKENFEIAISDSNVISVQNDIVKAINYGSATVTITYKPTGAKKDITFKVMMKIDDIVQGFRDADLPDGIYEVAIQDEVYQIELMNYYDNMTYSLEEGKTTRTVLLRRQYYKSKYAYCKISSRFNN